MALIDYSSSPHATRVRELRVDRLLSRLYFNYGLQHYVSWSKQTEWRYASVQSASTVDGGLRLRMFNVNYTITTHRENEFSVEPCLVRLKLAVDNEPVYDATYLEIGERDELPLVSVACFREGEWLQHFRTVLNEAKEVRAASSRRMKLDELTAVYEPSDDEFYSYSLAIASPSESQCQYGSGRLFPCPLLGSQRAVKYADGLDSHWMCDYHWAKFYRTIVSLTMQLKKVSRPRRCEWDGCSHLVGEALVIPSKFPGVPALHFFCEKHRPLFLGWVNDRTKKVRLRLGPVVRRRVQTWLAARQNRRRPPNEER